MPQAERQEHLDEMTCMLYLERQLERARALEVSAHTQSCDACRTLLRAMERESRLLTRAMLEEEEPLPARIATFQERVQRSMQWIWMVVFGLAATAVYAMYTGLYRAVGTRSGTSRIWRHQFDELADFSRLFLERMAIDDFIGGSAGAGDAGRVWHCWWRASDYGAARRWR